MKKFGTLFFIALVALFSLFTYLHAVVKESVEGDFPDFRHYYDNSFFLKKGLNIWEFDKLTIPQKQNLEATYGIKPGGGQIHSAGFFLLVTPFTLMPYEQAALLWLAIGLIMLFGALGLSLKSAGAKNLEDLFIAIFLFFSFWPMYEQLHMGQPNFITLLLISMALFMLSKGGFFRAGLCLGIACIMREYFLALAVYAWLKNRRMLIGMLLGFLGIKIAALGVFGWGIEGTYWPRQVWPMLLYSYANYNNITLIPALTRILAPFIGTEACRVVGYAVALSLFITTLVALRKNKPEAGLGLSLFLTLTLLISPWLHEAHIVILLPVFVLNWLRLEEVKNKKLYAVFIASYLLLALSYSLIRYPLFHAGVWAFLASGKALGLLLLFLLQLQLIKPAQAAAAKAR